jgi:hypothetical protein
MPQAAAQSETGDARGRDQPSRRGQAVPLGGLVEDTPGDSASRPGPASPDVDLDGLHRRQVDDEAVVAGRVAGDVVGAAADSNAKPGVGSELQGSGHVRGAGAPRDHGRSTVDHAVPDPACEVVLRMPGHDHLTGDLTGEPAGVDGRHGGHLPTVDAPRGCQPAIRTFSPAPGSVAVQVTRVCTVLWPQPWRARSRGSRGRPTRHRRTRADDQRCQKAWMAGGGASTPWADCGRQAGPERPGR